MSAVATRAALSPGARLWRADGLTATVVDDEPAGLLVLIAGEQAPVRIDPRVWRLALPCEHCDRPGEVQLRDGDPDVVLCLPCAGGPGYVDQVSWLMSLDSRTVRALFRQCAPVG